MLPTPTSAVPDLAPTLRPKRGLRWGIALVLLAGVVGALTLLLDPWLRSALEKQVATASAGRYRLAIGELRTHWWARTLVLREVRLRTTTDVRAASVTLPNLSLDVTQLRLAGIGLGAVLRREVVPLDSVVLTNLQLQLGELPTGAATDSSAAAPLYQRLPLGLPGVRVGYVALRSGPVRYGSATQTRLQFQQATLTAHDLQLSAAGAADTTRLGYAATVTGRVQLLLARVPGHVLQLRRGAFSSARQQLTLDSLRLLPLQPLSNQRTRTARLDLSLPHLALTGLRAAALARGRFQATEVYLVRPRLLVAAPTVPPPPLHRVLAPYLSAGQLDRLRLTDGRVQVLGLAAAPAVQGIHLTGHHLRLQPDGPGRLCYARAWQLRTGRARLRLDAPYYRLAYQTLEADTRRGQLFLGKLALAPTMPVAELARRKGHQTPHVSVQVPQVRVEGLDMEALLEQGNLLARQVEVRGARVVTESDGRFAVNPRPSVATPEAIGQLPFRVNVRQVRLQDVGIRMRYRSPRSAQAGVMALQQLAGTFSNLSNDPRRMSADRPFTGQLTGRIQRHAPARLVLQANLLDARGAHTIRGTFGAAPLAMLNPMVLPTRGLRLRTGQIEQIRFQMQLDRTGARGRLWATYHDLKLDLLNRQNRPGVLHRLGTMVANGVFLRDNNPRRPGQELKIGTIQSNRELRYSVFSLWRQGLVSGLLSSAGVPAGLAEKLSEAE